MSKNTPHVSKNSGENEWYTPAEYLDAARRVMGKIDLDPASSSIANSVVLATNYYTKEQDGLKQEWYGRVWLNPPYGAGLIKPFAIKLVNSLFNGNVTEAIVLVNNATETGWFKTLYGASSAVCFPTKRIRYWRVDGDTNSPLQGQAFIYFGQRAHIFIEEFRKIGLIYVKH